MMTKQSHKFGIASEYHDFTSDDEDVRTNLEITALALAVGLYLMAAVLIL
jgi:hypothetical protein